MDILHGIRRPKTSMEAKVAEGVGFEPTEVFNFAGFQDQCFQPLSHPSEHNRTQTLSDRRQV